MKVYLLVGTQYDCEDSHFWVSSVWGCLEAAAVEMQRLIEAFTIPATGSVPEALAKIRDLRARTPKIDPGAKTSDDWGVPEYEIQEHEVHGRVC